MLTFLRLSRDKNGVWEPLSFQSVDFRTWWRRNHLQEVGGESGVKVKLVSLAFWGGI